MAKQSNPTERANYKRNNNNEYDNWENSQRISVNWHWSVAFACLPACLLVTQLTIKTKTTTTTRVLNRRFEIRIKTCVKTSARGLTDTHAYTANPTDTHTYIHRQLSLCLTWEIVRVKETTPSTVYWAAATTTSRSTLLCFFSCFFTFIWRSRRRNSWACCQHPQQQQQQIPIGRAQAFLALSELINQSCR